MRGRCLSRELVSRAGAFVIRLGVVVALGAAGCEAEPAPTRSGLGATTGGSPSGATAANDDVSPPADPWGTCHAGPDSLFGFPDVCSTPETSCTGWGGGDSTSATYYATCDHSCLDAPCPTPSTGDVVPVCIASVHACQLPCTPDSHCPDGMICKSTAGWGLADSTGAQIPLPFICVESSTVVGADAGVP